MVARDSEAEAHAVLDEIIAKADVEAVEGFGSAVTQAGQSTGDKKGMWQDSDFKDLVQYNDGFRTGLIGTPEQIAHRILEYKRRGVDLMLLGLPALPGGGRVLRPRTSCRSCASSRPPSWSEPVMTSTLDTTGTTRSIAPARRSSGPGARPPRPPSGWPASSPPTSPPARRSATPSGSCPRAELDALSASGLLALTVPVVVRRRRPADRDR